jgi:hypothetical protein
MVQNNINEPPINDTYIIGLALENNNIQGEQIPPPAAKLHRRAVS